MNSWILGFVTGLMLGTAMLAAGIAVRHRRMRRIIEALIDGGNFRLQTADGQPATATSLLQAIDGALGLPPPGASKKLLLVAVAMACTGAAAGWLSFSMAR